MGIEGIQAMVNAVTSASPDLMVFVEHKMLGVSLPVASIERLAHQEKKVCSRALIQASASL